MTVEILNAMYLMIGRAMKLVVISRTGDKSHVLHNLKHATWVKWEEEKREYSAEICINVLVSVKGK